MAWELRFMAWANAWWNSPFLDRVIPWVTHLGSHVAVIVFIISFFLLIRTRKALRYLLLLYGIQSGVVYGLKFLINRKRPFVFVETLSRLSHGPGEIIDPSFPSAHSLYAFMMATLLAARFPRYRIIFYMAAGFVGWTRIYLGLHFPTDVIAGGVLGYGITSLFMHWRDLGLEKAVTLKES
ncbi:MAG: phosphatase PAP2 family protein [Thermodesulfobacteriota bacterium]